MHGLNSQGLQTWLLVWLCVATTPWGRNRGELLEQAVEQLESFQRDGFLVLRSVFDAREVALAHESLNLGLWVDERSYRPRLHLEVTQAGTYSNNHSIPLRVASRHTRRKTYRVRGVHTLTFSIWQNITYDRELLSVVRWLTCPAPQKFFSLLMERGTQQGLHDDTWYNLGSDYPGGMVGVWVALDDVDSTNGPLIYVPGSHLRQDWALNPTGKTRSSRLSLPGSVRASQEAQDWAYRLTQEWTKNKGLETKEFHAQAGDVAIWHERLFHGGGKILDRRRTRTSLVLHYIC